MQYIELDKSNNFELERIQNRQLRLENYLFKNKNILDEIENTYLLKNSTPPSSSYDLCNYDYLKHNSKDLEMGYDYQPFSCPICFDTIWRDTSDINCFYCNKSFCFECYLKIEKIAYENNTELACPLCRGIFTTYENNENNNQNDNDIDEELRRISRRRRLHAIIEDNHNNRPQPGEFLRALKIITVIILTIIFVILLYYNVF